MAKKSSSSATETTGISTDETTKTVSELTTDSAQTTDTVVAVIEPEQTGSTPNDKKADELIRRSHKSSELKLVRRKSIKGKNSKLSDYVLSEPTTTTGVVEYPTNYGTPSSDDEDEENIYAVNTAPPEEEIPDQPITKPKSDECIPSDPQSPCQFYNRKKCDPPAYQISNIKFHAVDKCSQHSSLNKPEVHIEEPIEPIEEPIEERKDSLKPILKTPDTSKYPDETYKPTSYFTDSESTDESSSGTKPVAKTTGTSDTTKYPEESTTPYGTTDLGKTTGTTDATTPEESTKTTDTDTTGSESTYKSTSELKPVGRTVATTDTTKYPDTTEYPTTTYPSTDSTDESTSYPETTKPSGTTAESPTSEYSPTTAYLTTRMEEFGIVPDLLGTYPSETLEVIYPKGVNVQLGNTLTPRQVKQKPIVKWDADPDSFYLLCMTDPDAPSREEPKYREWNHWLVGNIPGDQVNEGETLSEYIGAGPPKGTGVHRYAFLLYLQNDKLDFKREPRLTNKTADRRAKFSIKRIARRYKLGDPIAGNFFVAEWDTYVPRLYKQLGYPACLHLCQDN